MVETRYYTCYTNSTYVPLTSRSNIPPRDETNLPIGASSSTDMKITFIATQKKVSETHKDWLGCIQETHGYRAYSQHS